MAVSAVQLCLRFVIGQGQARNIDSEVINAEAAADCSRESEVTEGEKEGGVLSFSV